MSTAPTNVSEYDVIADVVQHYIDGAKSGRGDHVKDPKCAGQAESCPVSLT